VGKKERGDRFDRVVGGKIKREGGENVGLGNKEREVVVGKLVLKSNGEQKL